MYKAKVGVGNCLIPDSTSFFNDYAVGLVFGLILILLTIFWANDGSIYGKGPLEYNYLFIWPSNRFCYCYIE